MVSVNSEIELAASIAAWRLEHRELAALIRAIAESNLLKGGALCAFVIAAIMRNREPLFLSAKRVFALRVFAAGLVSIACGRLLQTFLPHRDRPFVHLSDWAEQSAFAAESSFPSDHAVYMTAIATSILFVDRRVGAAALAWTAIVVLLPRVLQNYHYPSDILAGAMIGAMIASAIMALPVPEVIVRKTAAAEMAAPTVVYPLAFLLALMASTNFGEVRTAISTFLAN